MEYNFSHGTEQYTADIEQLTNVYLDGITSGITTALMNIQGMPHDLARHEAGYQVSHATNDPAFMETIRDTVRARMRGVTEQSSGVFQIHQLDD